MTRISTFCVRRSALVIVLLGFGLVPLMPALVEAGHGGVSSHSGGAGGKPLVEVPQPVSPQPPSRLQGIRFNSVPDARCAKLTDAQRRATPGCGAN